MLNAIKRNKDSNIVDSLVQGIVDNMGYSDIKIEFPNTDNIKKDFGVDANWFIPAISGLGNDSERSAINQYVNQAALFGNISSELMGIAIVEMNHLDKLSDLVLKLGGEITKVWSSEEVKYGSDVNEALIYAIDGEVTAIEFYDDLLYKLHLLDENETVQICIQFINKILADEKLHLEILQNLKGD